MELKDKNPAASDDEDDIEKLRLAALQSLRRTVPEEMKNIQKKSPPNQHKRRNFQGRNTRNGQFYNRQKHTNLISIPTVGNESTSDTRNCNKKFSADPAPKLILPQDRYCNIKAAEDKPSSKFDRYDNSDKSESESECENDADSESESPGKLEKSDSLEALMRELENEIQGDSKPKEEKVVKPKKKSKVKTSTSVDTSDTKETIPVENVNQNTEVESKKTEDVPVIENKEEIKQEVKPEIKKNMKFRNIDRKRSPLNKRFYKKYSNDRNIRNNGGYEHHQPYVPPVVFPENLPFNQTVPYNQIMTYNNVIVNPPIVPLPLPQNYSHPPYDRPPSPLSLNTDGVLTITRAPLSPRSAAFVLQNREIIERRKKSPRRSYSRSPSPRYRRSKSPLNYRRSLSPRKFLKSKSRSPHSLSDTGRKLSPIRDKIDLPRDRRTPPLSDRRSPLKALSPLRERRSPPRSKLSPLRQRYNDRRSPNSRRSSPVDKSPRTNYRNSPKGSLRERLGNRNNPSVEVKPEQKLVRKRSRSLSLSPEPKEEPEKIVENTVVDPILEARRKKFETNEIKNTEGIIRLKPKVESSEENESPKEETPEENVNEDDLLDLLNTDVDDIFSDETDEENEGRFKSNLSNPQRNVSVLPLIEDSMRNTKTEVLKGTNQSTRNVHRERSNRKRQRSRSPTRNKDVRNYKERMKSDESKTEKKHSTKDKLYAKSRVLFRNGSSRKEKALTAPIESKKIEIKIRNPSKYETTSKYDVANEHETMERIDKSVRKVEVSDVKKETPMEIESEVSNDNQDDLDNADRHSSQKCEAGDLRAQLSRKRAERQSKLPVPEDVQSRLLQNALQGAVFKKPKKSRKERDSAPKDGKLPIHLRLGFANSMDIFQEAANPKRKRSKNKGQIEQV